MKNGCRVNFDIPKCSTDCPIVLSCKRKHTHPQECYHRPAQIGTNLSNGFAMIGTKRIAISESVLQKGRDVAELRLRIGVCGECPMTPQPQQYKITDDLSKVNMLDWIEGVGDITTHYELNFIHRFAEAIKTCSAPTPSTDDVIPFSDWITIHDTLIRKEERNKILRLVESDEWQKEHDEQTRYATLNEVYEAMISSDEIRGDCMRDAIRVVNSLRTNPTTPKGAQR
jgi:hypothetical protein